MASEELVVSGVDSLHPCYVKASPVWEMIETILGGTEAMRAAGQTYLPQYDAEPLENYQKRLAKSVLLPAFSDTLDYLVGKVFQRPISLDADQTPEPIRNMVDNIDTDKNDLNIFATWVFRDMMAYGVTHILIDMALMPRNKDGTPKILTKAEEKAAGGRMPYWVHIKARQVIGWRVETIDGAQVPTQVRIAETVEKPVGDFGTEEVEQIRVLEIGRFRIYQKEEGGAWAEIPELGGPMLDHKGKALTYIPLVTLYAAEKKKPMTAEPPLLDLAYKNVEHYQVHSDYRNCLTMACFPILVVSGYKADEDSKIAVGPTTLFQLASENARAYYAEHSGKALGSARTHLEDLKQEMAASGLQLLMPKTGATPTATGEAIDAAKSTSELQTMVQRLRDGLEKALNIVSDWIGQPRGSKVIINTDLTLTLGKMDIDQLIKAGSAPAYLLPKEVVWKEMMRRGFLSDDQEVDDIKDMLDKELTEDANYRELAGTFLSQGKGPPASAGSSPNLPGNKEPGTGNPPIGT